MGMRKNLIIWFLFPLFLDEKKKKGRKASGKTRNATAGKGTGNKFSQIQLLSILDRVTGNCELTVADYIISDERAY